MRIRGQHRLTRTLPATIGQRAQAHACMRAHECRCRYLLRCESVGRNRRFAAASNLNKGRAAAADAAAATAAIATGIITKAQAPRATTDAAIAKEPVDGSRERRPLCSWDERAWCAAERAYRRAAVGEAPPERMPRRTRRILQWRRQQQRQQGSSVMRLDGRASVRGERSRGVDQMKARGPRRQPARVRAAWASRTERGCVGR